MTTHFDPGPDFEPDDPLAAVLHPSPVLLAPPPGRYEAIRRGAARRRMLRAAAGVGLSCAVAVLVALPFRLAAPGAPASPPVPAVPPAASNPPAASDPPASPFPSPSTGRDRPAEDPRSTPSDPRRAPEEKASAPSVEPSAWEKSPLPSTRSRTAREDVPRR